MAWQVHLHYVSACRLDRTELGLNLEDIEGLKLRIKGILYQRKLWTGRMLARRLRKDLIKALLTQMGETLRAFVSYKGTVADLTGDDLDQARLFSEETSHVRRAARSIRP